MKKIPWPTIFLIGVMVVALAYCSKLNYSRAIPLKVMGDPNASQVYYKEFRVTAYCKCKKCCGKDPGHPAYGITASGYKLRNGDRLVAASKNFKFGTKMEIPGYNEGKPVTVQDRGGAIKGDRLDVLFNDSEKEEENHKKALQWGKRKVIVKIWVK